MAAEAQPIEAQSISSDGTICPHDAESAPATVRPQMINCSGKNCAEPTMLQRHAAHAGDRIRVGECADLVSTVFANWRGPMALYVPVGKLHTDRMVRR